MKVYCRGTPASPQKVLVWGCPGLKPHFAPSCARFLPLYCRLSWRSSLQKSLHWKMQNGKLSVCSTSAGCICSNREKFAQQASETGSVSSSSAREEAEHTLSTQESSYTCPLHCQAASGWLFAVVTRFCCCLASISLMWLLDVSWSVIGRHRIWALPSAWW